MLISQILRSRPQDLEWMVLFNLSEVSKIAGDIVTKAMYFLPEDTVLTAYSHVVLSSQGRYLATNDDRANGLLDAVTLNPLVSPAITPEANLASRFQSQLELFDVDSADCLGLGEQAPYAPVLLHLKLEDGCGKAQAIFESEPTQEHYELLRAVGVTYQGGESHADYYLARFENRLPTHIHAGILSHFSRTANCNLFFLQQGNIDDNLKAGLLQAAAQRIQWRKERINDNLNQIAIRACEQPMAMTCFPPTPAPSFPYGDLVPLGFLAKALQVSEQNESYQLVQKYLLDKRSDRLWAFASDRLITATDSALVLQGLDNIESIEALEQFSDGAGGYYPQLWSQFGDRHKMLLDDSCQHWCQPDYATTCMIRALRQSVGLSTKTSVEFLRQGMATRSGLYFANPYLVDYYLAQAIAEDDAAVDLRQQLLTEILASRNTDFSFGTFDRAFSTSLAIATLATLGYRGRGLQAAQLKLLEFVKPTGELPIAIPFYSSLKSQTESSLLYSLITANVFGASTSPLRQSQTRTISGEKHDISLYLDTYKIISTAMGALALSVSADADTDLVDVPPIQPHPRYRCSNQTEYIANFALPPYLKNAVRVSAYSY
ncbi:MAG: hypothetical protein AAFO95_07710 [Cyanobacteria bacterium J06600_6]